jgi:hypothetical protein
VQSGLVQNRDGSSVKAIDVSPLDANLLDATLRLVRLIGSPAEYRALSPLVIREIVYRPRVQTPLRRAPRARRRTPARAGNGIRRWAEPAMLSLFGSPL